MVACVGLCLLQSSASRTSERPAVAMSETDLISLINDIGLSDKANAEASTLSGGQKRRLSVGIALVGRPAIVFLDEPTSGLGARGAYGVLNILGNLRKQSVYMR